jgi:macrolide-specific efflux system membrane fusion protein
MRKFVLAGAGIAILVAVAVAWGRVAANRTTDPSRDAQIARVSRRDIGTAVKATGIIKPMVGAEVKVGSRVSGVVQRLLVRVGDSVAKGQLLAELDARDLQARRDESAAALEVAEANLRYAESDLRRKGELRAAELLPPSDLDLATQAFSVAQQQRAQARANLDYAITQLDYARIVAPIAGVVSSVTTQEGETVAASFAAPTFVTLLDLTRLEVRAYVDETDIGRIRQGQQARFTVDTYPNQEFVGRVVAVYPQAEIRDNVVDYVTEVRFQAARDRVVRPEMTTTVRILLDTHEHVLAVPIRAVRRADGRPFVWYRQGETVERRWVTTGLKDDSYWEIVDGLREGDAVVVGDVKAE